jgi:hypothetical protein
MHAAVQNDFALAAASGENVYLQNCLDEKKFFLSAESKVLIYGELRGTP